MKLFCLSSGVVSARVTKLSDIVKAVTESEVKNSKINALVCLCDVTKAKMYLRNFGEFYIDQISHAKTVILSRTDIASKDKVEEALNIIRENNDHCLIVTTPVDLLSEDKLIALLEEVKHMVSHHHHHHHHDDDDDDEECECHHHHHDDDDDDEECECHHHHHHDEDEECDDPNCECHHHHNHDADEVFTSFGFETAKIFDEDELKSSLNTLANSEEYGIVLRAKGIIAGKDSWFEFDLVPGQYDIRKTTAIPTGKLCVIGSNLKKKEIKELLLK